jgi:hypothetical protein
MTEEQMIELWGDGTEFGMTPETIGAMNNAFREVAMRFAQRVAEIEYDRGWEDRADAEYLNSSYPTGLVGDPQ